MRWANAGGGGFEWITVNYLVAKVAELEKKIGLKKGDREEARAVATEKLRNGGLLTREEVAAYIDGSTKKVQRLENAGLLRRCPNLGALVRYAASDVLRLASAKGKES